MASRSSRLKLSSEARPTPNRAASAKPASVSRTVGTVCCQITAKSATSAAQMSVGAGRITLG